MFQINRRKKVVSSLAFLAAVGLTIGLSSWALGQTNGIGQTVSAAPSLVDADEGNTAAVNPFELGVADELNPEAVYMVSSSGTCYADIYGPDGIPDGFVGIWDLLFLFSEWGINPGSIADINAQKDCDVLPCGCDLPDFIVTAGDLLCLFAAWGPCP